MQDVFIKIWENNLRISNGVSLDSYLYVAVRNGCVSYKIGRASCRERV